MPKISKGVEIFFEKVFVVDPKKRLGFVELYELDLFK
jgi:hypothetical protein